MKQTSNLLKILQVDSQVMFTTSGMSMWPLFRHRQDTIIVNKKTQRLQKYDIALYVTHSRLTLHRVIDVTNDGYVICGDNCLYKEYSIQEDQVFGYVSAFYRGNHYITCQNRCYKCYVYLWVWLYPLRCFMKKVRRIVGYVQRKILAH